MMDFDLMLEFYEKLEESKKGFDYFPENWENPVESGERFKDYARISTTNCSEWEIPIVDEVGKNYKGFVKVPTDLFDIQKLNCIFTFVDNGDPKYSQIEKEVNGYNFIETQFYHGNFSLERVYAGHYLTYPLLRELRRTLHYDFPNKKMLKVTQNSKSNFNIEFFKGKEKFFDFFLDGNKYEYHQNIVNVIKECPEIFYDLDFFKTYFSSDFFERQVGEGNTEVISVLNCVGKWQNA
ncbi:MAG: hypothetical protein Q8Q04_02825 [archaeon]|nr:hypothetical protein [archaeon]